MKEWNKVASKRRESEHSSARESIQSLYTLTRNTVLERALYATDVEGRNLPPAG